METAAAAQLAQRCLPALQRKGLGKMQAIASVSSRRLQALWTGVGGVDEVIVKGDDGTVCSFIAKSIGSHKDLANDELALVDHMSYYNEATFYEQDLASRMCRASALCPEGLLVDRRDGGEITICMTKLTGQGFARNEQQTKAALTWLARLHALFWGEGADAVVAAGSSKQACFWHLDTRQIELNRMAAKDPLRLAAVGIDARLKADKMQTMCHGDPKGANIMWHEAEGVSFYDFQWFGKAAASKDLAYFMGVAAGGAGSREAERALLGHYHTELCKLLGTQDAPEFEYLWASYHLALCDLGRWMRGGFSFGNTRLIFGHVEELLSTLHRGGAPLASEEEYRERIFDAFPP